MLFRLTGLVSLLQMLFAAVYCHAGETTVTPVVVAAAAPAPTITQPIATVQPIAVTTVPTVAPAAPVSTVTSYPTVVAIRPQSSPAGKCSSFLADLYV